jgi:hypothetical protein
MLKNSYILNFIIDAKFNIYNKNLLFLSWDWKAWCLTQPGGYNQPPPPHERNTALNRGRKFFHCLGAPNDLIRSWSEIFLVTRTERDMVKNVYWSLCKVPVIVVRFQLNWNSLHRFSKNNKISNFMKIGPVEAQVVTHVRTD